MASPTTGGVPERAGGHKSSKGLFQFSCNDDSDEEELLGLQALPAATRETNQDVDIIDQELQNALLENENETDLENTSTVQYQNNEEATDMFVPADEGGRESNSIPDNTAVKLEPESDDDLMMIDPAQAPATAQTKWAKTRGPWTIDLTNIKQEPNEAASLGSTLFPETEKNAAIEALEARKAELTSMALRGALSPTDLAELLQIPAQLNALAMAESNTSHRRNQAEEQQKKPRKSMTKEEYWAEREKKERNKKQNLDSTSRKRGAQGSSGGKSKKPKTSATTTNIPDDNSYLDESIPEDDEVQRQIAEMLKPVDAIMERAEQWEVQPEPNIKATNKPDQLKQMRAAAADYLDKDLLEKQEKELRDATRAWGPRVVTPKDGNWEVKGILKTPLLNHQIVVGAWMMGRELKNTPKLPRGGILADAMGLGKTIQTLSCISGNPPSEKLKDKGKGATLVICPSQQMLGVWASEIKKHCHKRFARDVVRYKADNKMDIELLGSFNIVLATYGQLRDSRPTAKKRAAIHQQRLDPEEYNKWLEDQTGDLHRIQWYRVVLDEAHAIKNHNTHSALVCTELKSKYRWVVSGTPLINSDTEFFPYLKFIGCHGIKNFSDYCREYENEKDGHIKRNRLISQIMYRRTQNDWFLGKPILNLPATHPQHQYLKLSQEEMVVFRMMERCFRRRVNCDLEKGGEEYAEKQINCYLTILLRLRQAATHPFLLEGMMGEYFTISDLRTTKRRLSELKGKKTLYEHIGSLEQRRAMSNERVKEVIEELERRAQEAAKFTTHEADEEETESANAKHDEDGNSGASKASQRKHHNKHAVVASVEDVDGIDSQDEAEEDADGMVPDKYLTPGAAVNSGCASTDTPPIMSPLQPFGRSDFGLHFDMDKQLEYLERLEELELSRCVICQAKPPLLPLKGQGRNCPKCKKVVGRPKALEPFRADGIEDDPNPCMDASPRHRKTHEKEYTLGFDHNGFQHYEEEKKDKNGKDKKPIRFLQISDKQTDQPVTPSAKMTALKETVLRWQAEAPDDKIVIFSQFNVVMKVVGRMLEAEGIPFNYLSGKQTTEQREKAVKDFQEEGTVKVLIVSLRAGGQCLTLTRGNRVILMELWWNHAVEQQAFSRVFRISQAKETHFVRFIVDTPIEKRMLSMQVRKILRIDAALQDEGVRIPKVGLEDIAELLGKVVRKNGVMQIVADYSDGEDDYDDDDDHPHMHGRKGARRAAVDDDVEDLEGFVVPDEDVEREDIEESEVLTDAESEE
ncbi:SNF2 family domain-containing protein [Colletotrichum truncatum]|uniref:SNF2 family domain-containing protein n=1 Tax=Colletotrichum truncatum TaxID=5467 RepID=A0ACC3YEN3_COLTU|nr:SNF2 family domain-containing protein [Colletotrichum truncatum]KAF6783255.1 SNF2 family domain-containing protein [Colletotrichum truncatum]